MPQPSTITRRLLPYTTSLVLLFTSLGVTLTEVPVLRLFELSICRTYYAAHNPSLINAHGYVSESLCKIPEIQAALANQMGWGGFFMAAAGLLATAPWAWLGERLDRRWIVGAAMGSWVMSIAWSLSVCYFYGTLPVKLAWAAAAFMFLGGGPTVGVALVHAIAADGLPNGMLSTYLLAQRSALTLVHVGALALGGYLMSLHLWIPVFVGLPLYILGLCLLPLIPETRHWGHNGSSRNGEYTAIRTSSDLSDPLHPGLALPPASESPISALAALKGSIILPLSLLRHVPTALFLSMFLLGAMTTASLSLLPQHLSTALSLPLSKIPYVESYRSLISGLLLLLVPVAIHRLRAHGAAPTAIDLGITQLSLVLLGTSFLALAAAGASIPGVAVAIGVQAASAGFFDAFKAWYVGVGAAREVVGVTGLFVAVGMVARTGAMVGDPVWAAVWALLIKIRLEWMLWVLAAGGCTCMGVVLWRLVGRLEGGGWEGEMDMDMDMDMDMEMEMETETGMEMEMEADTERKK